MYIEEEAMAKKPHEFDPFGIDFSAIISGCLRHHSTLSSDIHSEFSPIIQALQDLLGQGSPDTHLLRLYCLLVLRMLSSGAVALHPEPISILTPRQVECAKTACNILTDRVDSRVTIRELAAQLAIGESSLKNWFHAVYGKSISEYRRDLRITAAKRLLVNSDLSIFEIAGMTGYENQAKFTAMFHKYCGCTPTVFRRTHSAD